MSRTLYRATVIALLVVASNVVATTTALAEDGSGGTPAVVDGCLIESYYSTPKQETGFKGTTATSYQAAGPVNIDYTESETASQAITTGATVSVSLDAILAKAEGSLKIDYTKTWASTKSWHYSTSIPAGKTGIMAVLHLDDRVSTSKYTVQPNCSTALNQTFYSYIPRNSSGSLDYCVVRDLYPYGYNNWRSTCTGE